MSTEDKNRQSINKNLPIWERELTKREEKIMWLTRILFLLYTVVGLPIVGGNAIEFRGEQGLFTQLYQQLETFQHLSSIFLTAVAYITVSEEIGRFLKKRTAGRITPETQEKIRQKWIPLLCAICIGLAQWVTESGIASESLGTPDTIDLIYGILAILPIYIILQPTKNEPAKSAELPLTTQI